MSRGLAKTRVLVVTGLRLDLVLLLLLLLRLLTVLNLLESLTRGLGYGYIGRLVRMLLPGEEGHSSGPIAEVERYDWKSVWRRVEKLLAKNTRAHRQLVQVS